MRGIGAICAILLAVGALPAAAATPAPNLALCPRPKASDESERQRSRPLPVPAALRGVLQANLVNYAIATLGGGTLCVDTSWMETAEHVALSPDGRFLSFGWIGYEAYGHIVVDRAGSGEAIETGVVPVFSPSRRYFAAADQTESEFGSLSGLAVWSVGLARTTEIGRIGELPRMQGWRVDSWVGESCIELSAVALDLPPEQARKAPRIRFRAGPGKGGWRLSRNAQGCTTK